MDNIFIKEEIIKQLVTYSFKEEKTRLSSDALTLCTKLVHYFIMEAIDRSRFQSENEEVNVIDIEQFEKILPQLLLDF
uniref:Centromere protein X n=1 Tax=Hydra vulgaris TaxID=6087 RepID=T2MJY9_HYDVU